MSKIAPVLKGEELVSSSGRFILQDRFGKLSFFSVDRKNRWPQGWSCRGEKARNEFDEDVAAEEGSRPYTLNKDSRWPLQGWCKGSQPSKWSSSSNSGSPRKPSVQSRWPQGW